MSEPQVLFDVMLHVGTLAAILVVFGKDVNALARATVKITVNRKLGDEPGERMLAAIAVGCIPTALIGVAFSKQFERMFASMTTAGIGLVITGLVLTSTLWRKKPLTDTKELSTERIGLPYALLIGIAQGFTITPGISRSGTTIAVGLILGMPRELAARFSFLLAIPAILGALVFKLKDYFAETHPVSNDVGAVAMFSGTLVAAIAGIIALVLLLRIVRQGKISLFAYYCWGVGLVAIAFGMIKG